jgi:hypothetical protein
MTAIECLAVATGSAAVIVAAAMVTMVLISNYIYISALVQRTTITIGAQSCSTTHCFLRGRMSVSTYVPHAAGSMGSPGMTSRWSGSATGSVTTGIRASMGTGSTACLSGSGLATTLGGNGASSSGVGRIRLPGRPGLFASVGTDDSKHTVIATNMTTEIRAIFPKTLGPLKGH